MAAQTQTPEQLAESLVTVGPRTPGGPLFVRLREPGGACVDFGPYENPSLAAGDAAEARRFVAAVLRMAGGERGAG